MPLKYNFFFQGKREPSVMDGCLRFSFNRFILYRKLRSIWYLVSFHRNEKGIFFHNSDNHVYWNRCHGWW